MVFAQQIDDLNLLESELKVTIDTLEEIYEGRHPLMNEYYQGVAKRIVDAREALVATQTLKAALRKAC